MGELRRRVVGWREGLPGRAWVTVGLASSKFYGLGMGGGVGLGWREVGVWLWRVLGLCVVTVALAVVFMGGERGRVAWGHCLWVGTSNMESGEVWELSGSVFTSPRSCLKIWILEYWNQGLRLDYMTCFKSRRLGMDDRSISMIVINRTVSRVVLHRTASRMVLHNVVVEEAFTAMRSLVKVVRIVYDWVTEGCEGSHGNV